MTEQTGFPPAPDPQEPLTPEQEEFLRAQTAQRAAAESQGVTAPAAAVTAAMTERGPTLPQEDRIEQLMAQLRAQAEQFDAMQDQLASLQAAEAQRQAESGGPLVVRYAQSVKDHLLAHAVANPDLGTVVTGDGDYRVAGHFARPVEAADQLVKAAQALADRKGPAADVHAAADVIDRFVTRGHRRLTGKHADFGVVEQALEYVLDEATKAAA